MKCTFPSCCYVYIPEFTLESTWIQLGVRSGIIAIGVVFLFLFEAYLVENIDEDTGFTYWTTLVLGLWNLNVSFLVLIYSPYQSHIAPAWYTYLITIAYFGAGGLLALASWTLEIEAVLENIDEPAFDLWTIVCDVHVIDCV